MYIYIYYKAWKVVQTPVNGLRLRKLKYIKDILPFSKMTIYLKTVECPNSLIDTCKDIITALRKMGAAASGMHAFYIHICVSLYHRLSNVINIHCVHIGLA